MKPVTMIGTFPVLKGIIINLYLCIIKKLFAKFLPVSLYCIAESYSATNHNVSVFSQFFLKLRKK